VKIAFDRKEGFAFITDNTNTLDSQTIFLKTELMLFINARKCPVLQHIWSFHQNSRCRPGAGSTVE